MMTLTYDQIGEGKVSIELPELHYKNLVHFAVKCAWSVYNDQQFIAWAEDWLNGVDRSIMSARYMASRLEGICQEGIQKSGFGYDAIAAWHATRAASIESGGEWDAISAAVYASLQNPKLNTIKLLSEAMEVEGYPD